jgi:hypothetical protein
MMKGKKIEKMADRQEDKKKEDVAGRKRTEGGPAFFQENMADTILLNGVDQIVRYKKAKSWSQAISNMFGEARVMVMDVWVVKRLGGEVVSVLVKLAGRYQKMMAVAAVKEIRAAVADDLPRHMQCRVKARDAFPQDQLGQVHNCYNRGYQMKRAGVIQAFRVCNTGGDEPTFEVRRLVDGQPTWGPAPPPTGDTPATTRKSTERTGGRGLWWGDADGPGIWPGCTGGDGGRDQKGQ